MVNLCVFLLLGFFISGTDSQCATSCKSMADQMTEHMKNNVGTINSKPLSIPSLAPILGNIINVNVNFTISGSKIIVGKTIFLNITGSLTVEALNLLQLQLDVSISVPITIVAANGNLVLTAILNQLLMDLSVKLGTTPMLPPLLGASTLTTQLKISLMPQMISLVGSAMTACNKANSEFSKPFTVGNTLCQNSVTNVTVTPSTVFSTIKNVGADVLSNKKSGDVSQWRSRPWQPISIEVLVGNIVIVLDQELSALSSDVAEVFIIPDSLLNILLASLRLYSTTKLIDSVLFPLVSAIGITAGAGGNINVTVKTPPVLSSNQVQATAQVMASVIISNGTGNTLLSVDANVTFQASVTMTKGNISVILGTATSVSAMPPSIPCGCPNGTNSPAMEKFLFNIASSMSVNLNAAMEHTGTMVSPSGLQGAVNTTPMQEATKCTRESS